MLFPGQLNSDLDQAYVIWLIALLAVLSAGLIFARRINMKETVRNIAIWVAIAAVLIVGLSFRDEIESVAMRVRSELVPGYALELGEHEMVLTESDGGNFFIFGEANGVRVRFLIDTGASDTVLSPADAASLGIDVARARLLARVQHGERNGPRRALYARHASPSVRSRSRRCPCRSTAPRWARRSLGMTFLRRFRSSRSKGPES